jgi:hypothetical protein
MCLSPGLSYLVKATITTVEFLGRQEIMLCIEQLPRNKTLQINIQPFHE